MAIEDDMNNAAPAIEKMCLDIEAKQGVLDYAAQEERRYEIQVLNTLDANIPTFPMELKALPPPLTSKPPSSQILLPSSSLAHEALALPAPAPVHFRKRRHCPGL